MDQAHRPPHLCQLSVEKRPSLQSDDVRRAACPGAQDRSRGICRIYAGAACGLGLSIPPLADRRSASFGGAHLSICKHAFGFVMLMAVGCSISLFISLVFADRPLNLILIIGLVIFLEFLGLARGQAAAGIFLITTSFVPLMAISSLDLAYALVHDLVVGSILGAAADLLVHALFPARGEPTSRAAPNRLGKARPSPPR